MLHSDVHCVLKRILKVANDIILYVTIMTVVVVGSEEALINFDELHKHILCKDLPEVFINRTSRGSIKTVIFGSPLKNILYKSDK